MYNLYSHNALNVEFFSESDTTSEGYRRGSVSFAHFLLYLVHIFVAVISVIFYFQFRFVFS